MDKHTVRGVYENGEVRLATPLNLAGCWNIEITFVDQIADEETPFESDPHRPEHGSVADRLEAIHRQGETPIPHNTPR